MNTSLYIAKRYLFSKSRNSAINVITYIATIGVIISTIALFVILSAFSGLKQFNHSFINTSYPDLKISSVKGKTFIINDTINTILKKNKNIVSFSKVIEEHALFENKEKRVAIKLKAVDSNYVLVNKMDTTIFMGKWLDFKKNNQVIVGYGVANTVSTMPDSYDEILKIYAVKPGKGQLNKNSFYSDIIQTRGIFKLIPDIDNTTVFCTLNFGQDLLKYKKNKISALELKLTNTKNENKIINELNNVLGNNFKIETRKQLNATLYKMLNIENLFAYLIATLIGIIAFFNVIGSLIMIILDKKDSIFTYFNLGLKNKEIKNIFFYQGVLLTLFGLITGLIISFIILILQQQYGLFKINPYLPYPINITFYNFILVIVTILSLGLIASFIASSRVKITNK